MTPPKIPEWFKGRKTHFQPLQCLSCEFLKDAVAGKSFAAAPLTVAEVGARDGSDPIWTAFERQRVIHAFEPGSEEAGPLKIERDVIKVSKALWKSEGKIRIHVPKDGENASVFRPSLSFYKRLPRYEHMRVRDTVVVPATTLDHYAAASKTTFDVISLDVQGSELAVLQGASKQLNSSVIAVIAEVAFVELYVRQPRFREVDGFLEKHGFTLHDLDIRRWEKCLRLSDSVGMTGQIIYGDALYFREPMSDQRMAKRLRSDVSYIQKYIGLAELLGAVDLAAEVIRWATKDGVVSRKEALRWTKKLESNKVCASRAR